MPTVPARRWWMVSSGPRLAQVWPISTMPTPLARARSTRSTAAPGRSDSLENSSTTTALLSRGLAGQGPVGPVLENEGAHGSWGRPCRRSSRRRTRGGARRPGSGVTVLALPVSTRMRAWRPTPPPAAPPPGVASGELSSRGSSRRGECRERCGRSAAEALLRSTAPLGRAPGERRSPHGGAGSSRARCGGGRRSGGAGRGRSRQRLRTGPGRAAVIRGTARRFGLLPRRWLTCPGRRPPRPARRRGPRRPRRRAAPATVASPVDRSRWPAALPRRVPVP